MSQQAARRDLVQRLAAVIREQSEQGKAHRVLVVSVLSGGLSYKLTVDGEEVTNCQPTYCDDGYLMWSIALELDNETDTTGMVVAQRHSRDYERAMRLFNLKESPLIVECLGGMGDKKRKLLEEHGKMVIRGNMSTGSETKFAGADYSCVKELVVNMDSKVPLERVSMINLTGLYAFSRSRAPHPHNMFEGFNSSGITDLVVQGSLHSCIESLHPECLSTLTLRGVCRSEEMASTIKKLNPGHLILDSLGEYMGDVEIPDAMKELDPYSTCTQTMSMVVRQLYQQKNLIEVSRLTYRNTNFISILNIRFFVDVRVLIYLDVHSNVTIDGSFFADFESLKYLSLLNMRGTCQCTSLRYLNIKETLALESGTPFVSHDKLRSLSIRKLHLGALEEGQKVVCPRTFKCHTDVLNDCGKHLEGIESLHVYGYDNSWHIGVPFPVKTLNILRYGKELMSIKEVCMAKSARKVVR